MKHVIVTALVALTVTGCGGNSGSASRSGTTSPPPQVNLKVAPLPGQTPTSEVELRGTVTPGARVDANGNSANVRGSQWTAMVKLDVGDNDVEIVATKPGFKEGSASLTITRTQTAAELATARAAAARKRAAARASAARAAPARRRAAAAPSLSCITGGGYAGLYAPVSAFKAHHNMSPPGNPPIRGVDWSTILATKNGCVAGYAEDELASPRLGAADIAFLTEGISLPDDTTGVLDRGGCSVFRSPTLARASGFKYATTVATAQEGDTPAHAEIQLTNSASCP